MKDNLSTRKPSLLRTALLSIAALVGFYSQIRKAAFALKADKILSGGGKLVSSKFRRSRSYRNSSGKRRFFFPGHPSPRPARSVRNATRYFRGMAGMTVKSLEKLRAQNIAKRDHVWQDPRLQNTAAALAMAA